MVKVYTLASTAICCSANSRTNAGGWSPDILGRSLSAVALDATGKLIPYGLSKLNEGGGKQP
jgi:hypothetical protein